MTDGGYRGDLGAAQSRIAQLEEQLREAHATASPELAIAEAQHSIAVTKASQRPLGRMLVGAAAIWAGVLPVVVIAALEHAIMMAGIISAVALAFSLGMMWLTRYGIQNANKLAVDRARKQLEEARRLQRLEEKVRDLTAERALVRVADSRPELRVAALEEPVDGEEVGEPQEQPQERRR